jgi:hypothetical protein
MEVPTENKTVAGEAEASLQELIDSLVQSWMKLALQRMFRCTAAKEVALSCLEASEEEAYPFACPD